MFQSTRPAWGATPFLPAPRNPTYVSIHAPRVGRDELDLDLRRSYQLFQSTRPAWGATGARNLVSRPDLCFNPRAPRGARLGYLCSLLMGKEFQSTRPAWGATDEIGGSVDVRIVSIHAPRVGRDTPRGKAKRRIRLFQSTRPAWGATVNGDLPAGFDVFQSTRPAWGATKLVIVVANLLQFQSTRPAWGATLLSQPLHRANMVSIHAPRVGRDARSFVISLPLSRFNPRAPRGARHVRLDLFSPLVSFNPRAPRGARQTRMGEFLRV